LDIKDWLTIKKQVGISEDNGIETMKDDIDYELALKAMSVMTLEE
jgi:hypothetical protein